MGRDLNSSSPFPGTDPMRATDAAPLRLLLVEDSPADAYLVKLATREEGLSCDVQVASDGELAIEFIDQMDAKNGASLNLLLLDLNVPRRTGDEVLERIRRSPKCANIPVIVVTSSDSREDRQKASDLGADGYFRKPSNLTEFMELGKLVRRLTQKDPQETD